MRKGPQMKTTDQAISSNGTLNNQPKQLLELARLEIKRRELVQELAQVKYETDQLTSEIRALGDDVAGGV
jgi:hypothetical protein